jgi:hypothetical protein
MNKNRILFGEWKPDQADSTGQPSNDLEMAFNVYPSATGYAPFPKASPISVPMPDDQIITGMTAARYNEDIFTIAGTKFNLYKGNNLTRLSTDIVAIGKASGYKVPQVGWGFVQYGNSVLATNGADKIQVMNIIGSGKFDDIPQAPFCRSMCIVRDFVVAGYCDGESNRVQWSDLNNELQWESNETNQADFQNLAGGGEVKAVTGGEFGLILQDNAVQRMTYVGTPLIFQFDLISDNVGCLAGKSAIQHNGISYWLSHEGVVACDGTKITNIGNGKINEWLFREIDLTQMNNSTDNSSVAIDPIRNLIVWNFPTKTDNSLMLKYNYSTGRFSTGFTKAHIVCGLETDGTTLEALDETFPNLDTMPVSLDSYLFIGGQFSFCGAEGNQIVAFNLKNENAYLTTNDVEFGGFSVVTSAQPIVENGSAEFQVSSRNTLNDNITFSPNSITSNENRADLRSGGKYHRIRMHPTDNWSNAVGFDLDVTPQGQR